MILISPAPSRGTGGGEVALLLSQSFIFIIMIMIMIIIIISPAQSRDTGCLHNQATIRGGNESVIRPCRVSPLQSANTNENRKGRLSFYPYGFISGRNLWMTLYSALLRYQRKAQIAKILRPSFLPLTSSRLDKQHFNGTRECQVTLYWIFGR